MPKPTIVKTIRNSLYFGFLAITLSYLAGCSAAHTMIKKRNLDVQTKMSETIFLEPVSPNKKIVFIDIRNTSDQDLPIKQLILDRINQAGYTIVNDPEQANFMLQANILQIGKSDLREAEAVLSSGFGGAIAGASLAYGTGSSYRGAMSAGLLGGALGLVGDALVDDVLYSMTTDLQIRERPLKGEVITQTQQTNAAQGTATRIKQSTSGAQVQWKTYRTRIVSTANKANLKFEEAQDPLIDGLVRSISGIL